MPLRTVKVFEINKLAMSSLDTKATDKFVIASCKKYNAEAININNAIDLLNEGCTVPFISRYRKDQIGTLNPSDLSELAHAHDSYNAMIKSRDAKIKKLEENGKLTKILRDNFMNCMTMAELDELWLPFKEKNSTNSGKARSIDGMTELAEYILHGFGPSNPNPNYLKSIKPIIIPQEPAFAKFNVHNSVEYILTEIIAHDSDNRALARDLFHRRYSLQSNLIIPKTCNTAALIEKYVNQSKYRSYHNFDRLLHQVQAHQLLAIRRGSEKEDPPQLHNKITIQTNAIEQLTRRLHEKYRVPVQSNSNSNIMESKTLDQVYNAILKSNKNASDGKQGSSNGGAYIPHSTRNELLQHAISDAVKKTLIVSLSKEVHKETLKTADSSATTVFANNLQDLLLTPPLVSYAPNTSSNAASTTVCAIDPGFGHGHKVVILSTGVGINSGKNCKGDENGSNIKSTFKLYTRKSDTEEIQKAAFELYNKCKQFNVKHIAIGDGVGTKQAQEIVGAMKKYQMNNTDAKTPYDLKDVYCSIVSECGASVYSASEIARKEYPGIDISYLGCMSIGGRLVDPMSELVKVPPESLGIGMYQHDISAKVLQSKLTDVVETCVNEVGVDLNTASVHLLKYISGINETRAKAIVDYRNANINGFSSLSDLKSIRGIGAMTFKNAAGFLRILNGTEKLDATCVHPDQYGVAKKFIKILNKIFKKTYTTNDIGTDDLNSCLHSFNENLNSNKDVASDIAKELNISETMLRDICYWLRMRHDEVAKNNITNNGNKKRKLIDLTNEKVETIVAFGGILTDDIRFVRGVPPVSHSVLTLCSPEDQNLTTGKSKSKKTEILVVGSVVQGKVKNIAPFGAFIDLSHGGITSVSSNNSAADNGGGNKNFELRDGLLHVSAFNKHKGKVGGKNPITFESLIVGQMISVKVASIDTDRNRIGLALE